MKPKPPTRRQLDQAFGVAENALRQIAEQTVNPRNFRLTVAMLQRAARKGLRETHKIITEDL